MRGLFCRKQLKLMRNEIYVFGYPVVRLNEQLYCPETQVKFLRHGSINEWGASQLNLRLFVTFMGKFDIYKGDIKIRDQTEVYSLVNAQREENFIAVWHEWVEYITKGN